MIVISCQVICWHFLRRFISHGARNANLSRLPVAPFDGFEVGPLSLGRLASALHMSLLGPQGEGDP